jgi:hypothetical protein
VCLLAAACTGRPSAAPSTPPASSSPSPSAPPRVPFTFATVKVVADHVNGKGSSKTADRAGGHVQDTLASFYDAAFADPAAWAGTVPDTAWDAFASSVRDQARKDADSLTIGSLGTSLSSLDFPESKLTVRVLVDQHGKAQAALATVTVDGAGARSDGTTLSLTNRASFLLEPDGGTWLIMGYPDVKTSSGGAS